MPGKGATVLGTRPDNPVDELSQIRLAIRALRRREEELLQKVLKEVGPGHHRGKDASLTIKSAKRRVIDADRLPPEIREDARYWINETTHRLRVKPLRDETLIDKEPAIILNGDVVAVTRRLFP